MNFLGFECLCLENNSLSLLITRSVGPRVISLSFHGSKNLLAELPEFTSVRPDGKTYHFYGGHRLWHAPEDPLRTYVPDDDIVDVLQIQDGVLLTQMVEVETGIEKSIRITLVENKPQVILQHTLTNVGLWSLTCSPWAITQLRTGGIAIIPQPADPTGLLPNRSLALWPYTDISSPHVNWGNHYILLHAKMKEPFKIGFPNPRGWLAYWLEGTLFVKRAAYDSKSAYGDFGSSSECYCNDRFIELETLAPISRLEPGGSVTHTETWELYADVDPPVDEASVQKMVNDLGLE